MSLFTFIRTRTQRVYQAAKRHPWVTALLALLIVGALGYVFWDRTPEIEDTTEDRVPQVEVASVAALSQDTSPLIVLGEVRSVTQAELRPDKPGEVTRVNVRVGQFVGAGTILAEVENGAERAAVLSAQGGLAAAQANLSKAQAGARPEDRVSAAVQTQSAEDTLRTARETARSAYTQSYTLAEDAVFAKVDDFFTNAYTVRPSFRVRSANYDERVAIENERVALGDLLKTWQAEVTSGTLSTSQLDQKLKDAAARLARVKAYLNTISGYVSKQELTDDLPAATKAAQEGVVASAQASVDAGRASISGAQQGLTNAETAARTTTISETRIDAGERPEDIQAAQAAVTQARGGLAAAVAQLERSIIRTPIAGTVETLNITRGGYANGQDVVAVVANPGALEIEGFVSQSALERVYVGMPVLVAGSYDGAVTTLAPGLDPATKKARLTVGLPKGAQFVNGQYVELALMEERSATSTKQRDDKGFALPITAIKVLPTGLVVFTVSDDNTLEALPIEEGPIVGSSMLIEGLNAETRIVKDARGLSAGDTVTITTE